MSVMDRGELKTLLLDFLRANPHTQVENILQSGIEQKIKRRLSSAESQLVMEMIHELVVSNIIMPAADRMNSGWPWFGLTSYGHEVLARSGPPVYDYDGYMVEVRRAVSSLDSVVERYLSEALRAFQANLYLASMVMLGCASERAITLLINSYVAAIEDPANQQKLQSRVSGRDISVAYDRFRESFNSTRSQFSSAQIHDFDAHVDGIFSFIRLLRNSIVHPAASPNITNPLVYANLQQFVYYIGTIFNLVDHFSSNRIRV
jgi:hypothetical protein